MLKVVDEAAMQHVADFYAHCVAGNTTYARYPYQMAQECYTHACRGEVTVEFADAVLQRNWPGMWPKQAQTWHGLSEFEQGLMHEG